MKNKLCVRCGKREIKCVVRGLCNPCYTWLHHHGCLDDYPKQFPLPKKNRFLTHYSPELLGDLQALIVGAGTLTEVGKKYGVSRERVRQMFHTLIGFPFTYIVKIRSAAKVAERNNKIATI
jgi:hypothetical protein